MDAVQESGQTRPGRQMLWYVRRHGRELGPHPRRVILDGLLLGRFEWSDPASIDRMTWQPLQAFESLVADPAGTAVDADAERQPEWAGERRAAARRWADERSGRDRRAGRAVPAEVAERRAAGDRRVADEPLQVSVWRRLRLDRSRLRTVARDGRLLAAVALAGLAATLSVVYVAPRPASIPLAVGDPARCEAPAGPAVDWRECVRAGLQLPGGDLRRARLTGALLRDARLAGAQMDYADLSGADLGGAQLARARLFGASLRRAELRGADLSEADLSYADLREAAVAGARFDGTRLDHAVWIDGRRCAPGSTGRCD